MVWILWILHRLMFHLWAVVFFLCITSTITRSVWLWGDVCVVLAGDFALHFIFLGFVSVYTDLYVPDLKSSNVICTQINQHCKNPSSISQLIIILADKQCSRWWDVWLDLWGVSQPWSAFIWNKHTKWQLFFYESHNRKGFCFYFIFIYVIHFFILVCQATIKIWPNICLHLTITHICQPSAKCCHNVWRSDAKFIAYCCIENSLLLELSNGN